MSAIGIVNNGKRFQVMCSAVQHFITLTEFSLQANTLITIFYLKGHSKLSRKNQLVEQKRLAATYLTKPINFLVALNVFFLKQIF